MNVRGIAVALALIALSVPVSAQAYTASTEQSDNEHVSKHAEEESEAAEAEARNRESQPAPGSGSHEEAAPEGGGPTVLECVVPSLRGDSVSRARSALRRRHCELGRITRMHTSGRHLPVVIRQEFRSGEKHPEGTRVGIAIGSIAGHRS